MDDQLQNLTIPELLRHYVRIIGELQRRGVIRTENNAVGDYAEWLAAGRLNLVLRGNSNTGYDAVDDKGLRYQIKSRRLKPANMSTQLGAIRELEKQDFDYLIGSLFNADSTVRHVAKVPHSVIADYARFVARTNSYRLLLEGALLADARVEDVTRLFIELETVIT